MDWSECVCLCQCTWIGQCRAACVAVSVYMRGWIGQSVYACLCACVSVHEGMDWSEPRPACVSVCVGVVWSECRAACVPVSVYMWGWIDQSVGLPACLCQCTYGMDWSEPRPACVCLSLTAGLCVYLQSSDFLCVQVFLESNSIFLKELALSAPQSGGQRYDDVYQLCMCDTGRLFLAEAEGDCVATPQICGNS